MDDSSQIKDQTILAGERTRFAAERTISAWMRTGLASVGGGFAIVHLLDFSSVHHKIIANIVGELLIVWGICIFIFSLRDYKASCVKILSTIDKGEWWVTVTTVIFMFVSLLLLYVAITA